MMALPFNFDVETIVQQKRTTQSNIDDIKSWSKKTLSLEIQEEFICLFLLSCDNDLPKTENTIRAYFQIKNGAPELFNSRDVDNEVLAKTLDAVAFYNVPSIPSTNTGIHFIKLIDTNYHNFDVISLCKISAMMCDLTQNSFPGNDLILVTDLEGASLMHLTRIKIGTVRTFMSYVQEAQLVKIRAIHLLNANYITNKVFAIAKMFMKNDLSAVTETHPPGTAIKEMFSGIVPSACLPKDYGGDLPSLRELTRTTIGRLRTMKGFFEMEERIRNQVLH